ncbi:MAG: STAS domain-containing protein [Spirochaetaceae bacterium]|nr:STAS domain-containing protein [Spirochaetaceae bacterium]
MAIIEKNIGAKVVLFTDQRLDALSAPELEKKIEHIARVDKTVNFLVIDLSRTIYIASLGLRVLLQGLKTMKSIGGNFSIQNINPQIRPIFEMSGLMDLMLRDEKMVILKKDEIRAKVTLAVEGKLTHETAKQFEDELKRIADEYTSVYLDCSNLNFICNKGFEALSSAHNYISENGGSLILQNVSAHIKQLITGEKLDKLFNYSPVSVEIQKDKVFFSLAGLIDVPDANALRNKIEEILLTNKGIKEICLYLDGLTYASKQAVIVFTKIYDNMNERGISVKLLFRNPEAFENKKS